jgi:hypothetical protein
MHPTLNKRGAWSSWGKPSGTISRQHKRYVVYVKGSESPFPPSMDSFPLVPMSLLAGIIIPGRYHK